MIYPLIDSLRLSFFTIDARQQRGLRGLQNYVKLLTDPQFADAFLEALGNNFVFFLIHMIVQNSIGLLLAALLASRRPRTRVLPHRDLHADRAFGRHHRLYLAADPESAVGRRRGHPESGRSGCLFQALAGPGAERLAHACR